MAETNPLDPWPPIDGVKFIRSEAFGELLIELSKQFGRRYPGMDFSDAISHVFAWFDRKLSKNRRFINSRRFPTYNAFRAYLKQSLWNAGLLAQRQRQRREEIEALPFDSKAVVAKIENPQELDRLLDLVENLSEPHKTVFERYFFDEEDPSHLASILDKTEEEIHRIYEEAVDMLAK
jgi:RNA polymerase sigma factor (sigma-70 family)